jgi:outer membrane murein-binding lipoprotein Lpp
MTLRYHVISLVAVFLALAVGVVLGSTSVSQRLLSVVAGDRSSLANQVDQLSAQRDQLAADQRASNAFGAAIAATVVKGQLTGHKVVLVVAPGTDPSDRDAMRTLLAESGASLTGELDLTDAIADPARADALRDLTTRLLPAGAQLPSATDSGGLVGGLLGSVLLLKPGSNQPTAVPAQATAALTGLSQAGFVAPGAQPTPAQLVVVLTGGAMTGADAPERAATVARMASELDLASGGAVLAGRTGSDAATGPVGVVRADNTVSAKLSTVDDVQEASGRVAAIFALREQAEGKAGQYGSAPDAKSPIPGASAG